MFKDFTSQPEDIQDFLKSYAECRSASPPDEKRAMLVLKYSGEYFTLMASDAHSAVTAVEIKPNNGIHKAWTTFKSEEGLLDYIANRTTEFELMKTSSGSELNGSW